MAMTRSMIAKQNQNARKRKRSETTDDNDDSPSWSDLMQDMLFSIMLHLGVVDFIAFSGVCKSWRTVALNNKRAFMLSRQPMGLRISTELAKRKECWLVDHEGRKFRTILPHSSGRTFIGLTSGYLIFFGRRNCDFRLVNPITRHELHFPSCPFQAVPNPEVFRGILVFSPSRSTWVFVISARFSSKISFSLYGKQASWTNLSSDFTICDLICFKGKIYTLNTGIQVCEVKLDPAPIVTPVKMLNSVMPQVLLPKFATLNGKLFVMGHRSNGPYESAEVDFDQMKWVIPVAGILKDAIVKLQILEDLHIQSARFNYFNLARNRNGNRALVTKNMWYNPKQCADVNRLLE